MVSLPPASTTNSPTNITSNFSLWKDSALQELLTVALGAFKAGTLDELLRQRPRVTRWVGRRWLAPVLGTAGHGANGPIAESEALALLLQWAVVSLRPDNKTSFEGLEEVVWLDRTSWRPMLAIGCHFGFLRVPDFSHRYRRATNETPADNLCGLWSVGPSTFYRYLSKGREQIAQRLMELPQQGAHAIGLRGFVQKQVYQSLKLEEACDRHDWHRRQLTHALGSKDVRSTLWHALQVRDIDVFAQVLTQRRIEVARHAEIDLYLVELEAAPLSHRQHVDLCLTRAALWRTRNVDERERAAYDQALERARTADDKLLLGLVYGALGKYHETRDVDRAFSAYEDGIRFLTEAAAATGGELAPELNEQYVASLVRLAWLYVVRNDARSRALLDRAAAMRDKPCRSEEPFALLEQCWGEYWRRAGELPRALEHKHRALNIYERLNDQRSILATFLNLSLIYGENREFDRAIAYAQRVIAVAATTDVETEILVGARGNLGATYFWQDRLDEAVDEYRQALVLCERAHLRAHAYRLHYNLAEALYKRFQRDGRPADEAEGDQHAVAVMKAAPAEADSGLVEASRRLKAEVLVARGLVDRMLPDEFAAHFEELTDIQRHRGVLSLPSAPADHVRSHLAIAHAYLKVAVKEREAAIALIERHGLGDGFTAAFDDMRTTFARALSREQRIEREWKKAAADLLNDERRAVVLQRLLRDEPVTKSLYAELCAVGLATASKHLGALAERSLLLQVGKGPSTRYVLPDDAAAPVPSASSASSALDSM